MRELLTTPGLFAFAFGILGHAGVSGQEASKLRHTASGAVQAQSHIECSCRAQGRDHNIGTTICFETAAGLASFRCEMDQNVTSWRRQTAPCPLS